MKIQVLTMLFLVGTMFTAELVADNDYDMEGEMMEGDADYDSADQGDDLEMGGEGVAYGDANAYLSAGNATGLNFGAGYGAANIRTQRMNLTPRVMTQRVMAKPRVITERIVQPIYQRTVNKPSLLRERYIQVAQLNRAAPQVTNREPQMLPVKYTQSTSTRTMNVPGNTITRQQIIRPTLLIRKELVNVNQGQAQVMRHPVQTDQTQVTRSSRTKNVTVPGAKIHRKTIIQPIITRENVRVQVNRPQDQIRNNAPQTMPAVVRNRVNNRTVNVPGRTITRQRIIQPTLNTIRTQVRVVQSPVQRITNQPIFKKPIVTRSSKTVNHTFVHEVPIERVVHVPTPVLYRVPVYLGT